MQAPRLPDPPSGRVCHVWVKLDLDGPRAPLPGLVLDWRRTARGWEAWVVTVETYSTGVGEATMVRQGWRPVAYLRPAGSPPPAPSAWLRQPVSQSLGQANGQLNDS
jgi:hypothetical protein